MAGMGQSWSESVVELVTSRMSLLADPTRVHLLLLLRESEGTVQHLSDSVASTPQNISRHLGILHRAGIVARRREGTFVFYSLADYATCCLLDQVLECISGQIEELADVVKLAA
jgi:DNA-binding transcriptional ArsR family regulator